MRATRRTLAGLAVLAILAGCGGDANPELMNLRSPSRGPDEFAIVPTKPLVMPEDVASLPEPTPGGRNLTDPTPEADAIAALGGNAAVLDGAGVSGGLVTYASRFGVDPGIRAALATEDLEYRRNNNGRILERLFNVNVYFKAYRPMSLDQQAELARWRRAGVRTVGAPPDPEAQ